MVYTRCSPLFELYTIKGYSRLRLPFLPVSTVKALLARARKGWRRAGKYIYILHNKFHLTPQQLQSCIRGGWKIFKGHIVQFQQCI